MFASGSKDREPDVMGVEWRESRSVDGSLVTTLLMETMFYAFIKRLECNTFENYLLVGVSTSPQNGGMVLSWEWYRNEGFQAQLRHTESEPSPQFPI